ncbi:MAG: MFS transporter [Actinomycetota bacterium]|uniref:MFS transporter n=1 Tax=Mycobacterium lentiflavum TaxID=141349 RepID=A0ABY3V5Y6_MYCLN|nr:MFS transporter [Mycobacterium lentiflavum]MEE3067013.1 MFS transporter [Actinomycetota bacterium]ULP44907.1 MFS transporter [Mycobacterium lentiflavum]
MRRAKLTVAIVFTAHAVLASAWVAYIPQVKAQLGLSNAALGTALFGVPLGSVAAMIFCHWALPRWGSHRLVPVTLVGYALAGAAIGLASGELALFLTLTVWGVFQGALDVAMNTQAGTVERLARAPIMARFHGMWSTGGLLGASTGAACVGAGVGLTPLLGVVGVVVLVVAVPFLRYLVPDQATSDGSDTRSAKRFGLTAAVSVLALVSFASFLSEGAAADWSATYSRDVVGASPGVAALSYAAYTLLMVVTRLGATGLQARLSARRLLPALAVFAAIAMCVTLALGNPVVTVIGFACLGAGVALLVPTAFSSAYSAGNAGSAITIVAASGWLGYLLGPPLIGHLADWIGLSAALVTIPVMVCVAAIAIRATTAFNAADEFHRQA